MRIWTLKGYLGQNGRDEMKAKFKTIMQHLVDQQREFWIPPLVRQLTGYPGICEIRFRIQKVVYRPLGFFGPGPNEFTFLIPAKERDGDLVPVDAEEMALDRKKIVLSNTERAHVYRV